MLEPEPARPSRARRQLTAIACLASLTVAGCVTRADFERVRRDQQEMRASLADLQVSVDALSRRVDTMRSSQSDSKTRAAQDRVKELERRLADIEASRTAEPTSTPGAGAEASPTATPIARVAGSDAAQIAMRRDAQTASSAPLSYQRALQLYRDNQHEQAINGFRDFLRGNPKSPLADNAQYWIGEAYYAQGDYNRSIIEFNEVLLKFPQGDQVPGALLALASAFSTSGDKIDAKLVLQKLISDHPSSEEAQIGRQQLQSLAD
ncbi:tol-pal system protein YbgF [bacterium]|nr:tol-pal system protein YbgF [bacterium]